MVQCPSLGDVQTHIESMRFSHSPRPLGWGCNELVPCRPGLKNLIDDKKSWPLSMRKEHNKHSGTAGWDCTGSCTLHCMISSESYPLVARCRGRKRAKEVLPHMKDLFRGRRLAELWVWLFLSLARAPGVDVVLRIVIKFRKE